MTRSPLVSLCLICAIALTSAAQDYDRVLIPLPLQPTPGAYGSSWLARVAVTNISDTPVDVRGYGSCPVPCEPEPIAPHTTVYVTDMPTADVPAGFLLVERGRRNDLDITIRAFDRSREHITWGATVPAVTAAELFRSRFGINDVPVTADFRTTLRIFDFDATTPGQVRVRVYSVDPLATGRTPDKLVADFTTGFVIPTVGAGTFGHPGYVALSLSDLPQVGGAARIRVEIDPLDDRGEYWAFVSTTHNETQHVTVIAPR